MKASLTVFFEDPFWVGVFERIEDGKLSVCKVTFGAESIGMRFKCEYPDEANGRTYVSVISREEWRNEIKKDQLKEKQRQEK